VIAPARWSTITGELRAFCAWPMGFLNRIGKKFKHLRDLLQCEGLTFGVAALCSGQEQFD